MSVYKNQTNVHTYIGVIIIKKMVFTDILPKSTRNFKLFQAVTDVAFSGILKPES